MDDKLHALDKQVGLNTQALETLAKNQEYILKMQATQIETTNSVKITLEGMGKSDEFFMKEFLELKKDHKEHNLESIPTRDTVKKNKVDIGNVADQQRTTKTVQDRINIGFVLLVIGVFVKMIAK